MYKKIKRLTERMGHWMSYSPPMALSSPAWKLFKQEFKAKAPIRYWIKYSCRVPIRRLKHKLRRVSDWIRYRIIDRYHVLKTGLPPGYNEIETTMLHVNFEILRNFVEVEQAWHYRCWNNELSPQTFWQKYLPFYYDIFKFRSPELGLEYLNWASGLDDPSLPHHQQATRQAEDAREIRELYLWWVEKRPARKEISFPGSVGDIDDFLSSMTIPPAHSAQIQARNDQEEEWLAEDEEMLIRLIKIRRSLWT